MKITFKLNVEQSIRSRFVLENWDNFFHADEDAPCYNSDQHLSLDNGSMTYKGQRYPLWQDGLGAIVVFVLTGEEPNWRWHGFNWKGLERFSPIEYQTSDSRLSWWETFSDWISRASTEQYLDYCEERGIMPSLTVPAMKVLPVGMSEVRRCAEFNGQEVRLARRAERLIKLASKLA